MLAAILFLVFFGSPRQLAAQSLFEYDRTVPFEWQSEPLSPRKDIILTGASFQTRKGRRMDSILVEPPGKAAANGPRSSFSMAAASPWRPTLGTRFCWRKPERFR